jgi:hypothetical protein
MRCCIYLQGCFRCYLGDLLSFLRFFLLASAQLYEVRFPVYGFVKFLMGVVAAGMYMKQAGVCYSRTQKREQMVMVSRFLGMFAKLQTAPFSLVMSVHLPICIY